ncbi:hypothetical protein DSM25558_3247 [Agrobacterium sp. DSM 25558]|nr:hypothetical protein DSM25558_3247 [Agrobacterium sp. DSM 25558]
MPSLASRTSYQEVRSGPAGWKTKFTRKRKWLGEKTTGSDRRIRPERINSGRKADWV